MLNRFKAYLQTLKVFNADGIFVQQQNIMQDSVRHKQPFSSEQLCTMAPHDFDCPIIGCTKNPCFERQPDKIVCQTIASIEDVRQGQIKRYKMRRKKKYKLTRESEEE